MNNSIETNTDLPDRFRKLGFDEGEWEMFIYEFPNYNPDNLVKRYLEIARKDPYNVDWNTEQDILDANADTDFKHDITNDVLNSYYYPSDNNSNTMGGKFKSKKFKSKKSKSKKSKSKKSKSKKSRKI